MGPPQQHKHNKKTNLANACPSWSLDGVTRVPSGCDMSQYGASSLLRCRKVASIFDFCNVFRQTRQRQHTGRVLNRDNTRSKDMSLTSWSQERDKNTVPMARIAVPRMGIQPIMLFANTFKWPTRCAAVAIQNTIAQSGASTWLASNSTFLSQAEHSTKRSKKKRTSQSAALAHTR